MAPAPWIVRRWWIPVNVLGVAIEIRHDVGFFDALVGDDRVQRRGEKIVNVANSEGRVSLGNMCRLVPTL